MRLTKPRIEPLPEAEWNDEVRGLLEPSHANAGDGRVPNVLATIARHPKLLERWNVFGNHVLFESTLPAREREILILRIGWLCRSGYEWGQHVIVGRRTGQLMVAVFTVGQYDLVSMALNTFGVQLDDGVEGS